MVAENPTWRAPRIHGELVMLGFSVSERSVSRWMQRAPRSPDSAQRWLTFLRNHRDAIAAMDFFSVPTVTFSVLYVFFIIGHDRRRILHFNITRHPTSAWILQQLREAFPYKPVAEFLTLDHDAKYGTDVPVAVRSMDMMAVRTSVGCPWQNGVAERWVGSCRRELLDHVIAVNESHLKRLLASYCRLLPLGPHSLWPCEGDSGKADALRAERKHHSVASRRRPSSSVRPRCVKAQSWFLLLDESSWHTLPQIARRILQ